MAYVAQVEANDSKTKPQGRKSKKSSDSDTEEKKKNNKEKKKDKDKSNKESVKKKKEITDATSTDRVVRLKEGRFVHCLFFNSRSNYFLCGLLKEF